MLNMLHSWLHTACLCHAAVSWAGPSETSSHWLCWVQGNTPIPKNTLDSFKEGIAFVTYSLLCSGSKFWSQGVSREAQMEENQAAGHVADVDAMRQTASASKLDSKCACAAPATDALAHVRLEFQLSH